MVVVEWKQVNEEWKVRIVKDGMEQLVNPIDVLGLYQGDPEVLNAFRNILTETQVFEAGKAPEQEQGRRLS